MATPVKAPDLEVIFGKTAETAAMPSLWERVRKLLREIFEGHEEYLGITPD